MAVVQELLQKLYDKGEIERRTYEGWYCTPDERFWTEKEIVEGKCPDCGRPVERISEDNYFFLMSKYQERLIAHIEENPELSSGRSTAERSAGFPPVADPRRPLHLAAQGAAVLGHRTSL